MISPVQRVERSEVDELEWSKGLPRNFYHNHHPMGCPEGIWYNWTTLVPKYNTKHALNHPGGGCGNTQEHVTLMAAQSLRLVHTSDQTKHKLRSYVCKSLLPILLWPLCLNSDRRTVHFHLSMLNSTDS
jgi:hypothetical protein